MNNIYVHVCIFERILCWHSESQIILFGSMTTQSMCIMFLYMFYTMIERQVKKKKINCIHPLHPSWTYL